MSNRARSENEAEDNSEMAFSWKSTFPAAVNAGQTEHGRDEKSIDGKKFKYDKNMTFKLF